MLPVVVSQSPASKKNKETKTLKWVKESVEVHGGVNILFLNSPYYVEPIETKEYRRHYACPRNVTVCR
jgi:hypothetical protein